MSFFPQFSTFSFFNFDFIKVSLYFFFLHDVKNFELNKSLVNFSNQAFSVKKYNYHIISESDTHCICTRDFV